MLGNVPAHDHLPTVVSTSSSRSAAPSRSRFAPPASAGQSDAGQSGWECKSRPAGSVPSEQTKTWRACGDQPHPLSVSSTLEVATMIHFKLVEYLADQNNFRAGSHIMDVGAQNIMHLEENKAVEFVEGLRHAPPSEGDIEGIRKVRYFSIPQPNERT
jgi:hypothetical protein